MNQQRMFSLKERSREIGLFNYNDHYVLTQGKETFIEAASALIVICASRDSQESLKIYNSAPAGFFVRRAKLIPGQNSVRKL